MHTMAARYSMAALTLTLVLAATLAAGQTTGGDLPADKFDSAADAVAPFLDPAALAVVRFEPAKINVDAIHSRVLEILKSGTPASQPTASAEHELLAGRTIANQWLADFAKAGGREIYVVVTLGYPASDREFDKPWFFLAPLRAGADSQAITRLIGQIIPEVAAGAPATDPATRPAFPEAYQFKSRIINNTLVLATPAMLEQLQTLKPAPRPDLAKAFAAAGEGAIQAVYVPTADTRKVFSEMLPTTLPAEMGGGEIRGLARGTLWAAAGINSPPQLSLKVVAQTTDANTAKALAGQVEKMFDALAIHFQHEGIPPETVTAFRTALKPTVQGDQVVITTTAAQTEAAIKSLAVLVAPLREQARHTMAAAPLAAMGKGFALYALEHQDKLPPNLQVLVDEQGNPLQTLVNPAQPQRRPGFIYLKPTQETMSKVNGAQLLVYEAFDEWPRDGIWVLFAAGNVGMIRDPAEFRKLVADAGGEKSK